MTPSKVAVAFVGTGNYINFLPEWHSTCQQYLFPGIEKKYLIFTDMTVDYELENSTIYPIPPAVWPEAALFKYKYINSAAQDFSDCDWFLFIDADMKVLSTISPEELIGDGSLPYIGVYHPCYFPDFGGEKPNIADSVETNQNSRAYIENPENLTVYYQSSLWGGKVPQILSMVEELEKRTDQDLLAGIQAKWFDESHLNRFYFERPNLIYTLHPMFSYPEGFPPPGGFETKILHIEKDLSEYRP